MVIQLLKLWQKLRILLVIDLRWYLSQSLQKKETRKGLRHGKDSMALLDKKFQLVSFDYIF
jgi:hypothetical protein